MTWNLLFCIFHQCIHDLWISPGNCFPVEQSEQFAVPGKRIVIPPVTVHAVSARRSNVVCRIVHTALQISVFIPGTKLSDHDRDLIAYIFRI